MKGIIYESPKEEFEESTVLETPQIEDEDYMLDTPVNEPFTDDGVLLPEISKLADKYADKLVTARRGFTPIHVDEIASRVAGFYEKIRKVIDWKDDNALRRSAIERILKRILFPKLTGLGEREINAESLAETVTTELVRGGHLPNDTIPRERIAEVAKALNKYIYFLEHTSTYTLFEVKQKVNFATFILEIAACEVEEILTYPVKEYGLIEAMAKTLEKRISVSPKESLTKKEKYRQVYVATLRTLYDLDDNFIIYQILKQKYPNWDKPDREIAKEIAKKLPGDWRKIQEEIEKPITRKFNAIAERIDTVFTLLGDTLESLKEEPLKIKKTFENKKKLTKLVTKAYERRYKTLKTRLFRLAVFSTLSVFLSNWLTFYLVEVPLAGLFYEGFNFFAAIVDFLVPTAVMFFLVVIIRPPKQENIKKVISTTLGFVYKDEKQEHYLVRIQESGYSIFRVVIMSVYIWTIFLVLLGIASVFYIAKLPLTSVVFDTFTIALTVFAAVVIKNKSRELNVDEHTSVQDFLLDAIAVPVAKVGSILARKWKEYNVVAIFFNFIIETPFALVLDFIQGWSEFIKERRAELR
ncbi:MAG: hypothetical protein ACC618_02665 [Patescibacteria group bacterium]